MLRREPCPRCNSPVHTEPEVDGSRRFVCWAGHTLDYVGPGKKTVEIDVLTDRNLRATGARAGKRPAFPEWVQRLHRLKGIFLVMPVRGLIRSDKRKEREARLAEAVHTPVADQAQAWCYLTRGQLPWVFTESRRRQIEKEFGPTS